ncbi:MAG TPA: acyl-CoA dehydratase activase-related protein, partial [bacterium]|nr:acyl-CoA dehydratase activase-related protein [bacterium]
SVEKNSEYIFNKLKKLFPVTKKEVVKAFGAAYSHFIIKEHEQTEKGENYLAEMTAAKKPVFLLVGRPYNLYDKGINLGIPELWHQWDMLSFQWICLSLTHLALTKLTTGIYSGITVRK